MVPCSDPGKVEKHTKLSIAVTSLVPCTDQVKPEDIPSIYLLFLASQVNCQDIQVTCNDLVRPIVIPSICRLPAAW